MRSETLEMLVPISSSHYFGAQRHNVNISLLGNFFISCLQLPDLSALSQLTLVLDFYPIF